MKKTPYILKDLSIQKMPGFPKGLKSMTDLASNINIVVGPNASGKSSTARVIQQIIWHDNTKGIEVESSVALAEDSWEIKIDSGKTLVQRNGNEDQISGLPTVEGQQRYLLALHKLVDDKENDLAKEIARQSIGGFDLDAAQENLGYKSSIQTKGASAFKKYNDADENYKKLRNDQRDLKKEEDNLTDLKLEKEKSQEAARLNEFYDKVADYLDAKSEYSQLSEQINDFPNSIKKLTGEEYKNIKEYEKQIEECRNNIEKAKEEIVKSQKDLEKLTIPVDGINDITITEIEKRLEQISDFERDTRDYDKQIAGFESQESEALKAIDKSIDPKEWKSVNIDDVSGLDKMLQDAHQVLGEKQFLLTEVKSLEVEAKKYEKEFQNSETFIQGIKTLSEWLKEPTKNSGVPIWIVISISLLGFATALATFFVGWPGLLGLVLIAILALYAYSTKDKSSNSINVREKDFINSGLKAPSEWNTNNVANRIDELMENLKDIKDADRISQKLNNCKDSLAILQDRIDILNKSREEWIDKLQTAPGFPENNSNDFSSLYWFLIQVKRWQDAHFHSESMVAKRKELQNQYKNELEKINNLFEKSKFIAATDAIEGKATFNELKKQENIRKDQTQLIEQKNEQIKEQTNLHSKVAEKLSSIYKTLDIEENDKESVQTLVNQLDLYKQKFNDHYASEQAFLKKDRFLHEHSLYDKYAKEINDLSVDQAKEEAIRNKDIANKLENIQKQITSIETKIQERKKGHELEDMLTTKENAIDGLNQLYESNLSSAAGDLIINLLKKETQNKNRPQVFKRANKILNTITNGRYELLLGEEDEPSFRAYDTVLKLGQNLSELSTGTRVQLLLSVRLAYVETVESSIKLPLLADELLANSDDERAKAIIESLIEISRDGRQVFYFTAQADEVGKWLTYLEGQKDITHKIIKLGIGSNESYDYGEFKPDLDKFSLINAVPKPNGKNHKEYGGVISKLTFNALTQNSSELPLWYLIEDVDLLYDCLKRGIRTWGQLESYYNNNGQIQNFDKNNYNQLQNKIELLNRFKELYRKGRSLPIDRDILESSGAITPAFIDRVADKLNELNREPKQLLKALRAGEVPRFRAEYADAIEQYLMTEGYIDDQEVLESETILINMQALISSFEMEIEEAEDFITRILKSVDISQ